MDVFGDSGWGKVGNSLSGTSACEIQFESSFVVPFDLGVTYPWGVSLAVKYFSQTTSLCIIRVARDHFRTVWGALSFMNRLDGVKVVARVIGCSGQSPFSRFAIYIAICVMRWIEGLISRWVDDCVHRNAEEIIQDSRGAYNVDHRSIPRTRSGPTAAFFCGHNEHADDWDRWGEDDEYEGDDDDHNDEGR